MPSTQAESSLTCDVIISHGNLSIDEEHFLHGLRLVSFVPEWSSNHSGCKALESQDLNENESTRSQTKNNKELITTGTGQ